MKSEVSCINSRAILDYVKEHDGGDCSVLLENLDPEIDQLPDPESFLRDTNHWISCTVLSKLHERARLILQDEKTAYKIGRYAVEQTSLGYAQRIIIKAFWSSKKALIHAQKINDKWNKSKRVEIVSVKGNEGIIRLHWNPQMDVTKDMCLMNQGTYVFLPIIWGGNPLTLEEKHCYYEDAPYCEYHLKWPVRNRFYEIFSKFFTSKSVLMETIREMEKDKKTVEEKYEEVNHLNVALNQKIKQLMAVQETGKAILSVLDLDQLLTVIMNILSNVCKINRALIMLINEEKRCLEYKHSVGFDGDIPMEVRNYRVPIDRVSNILGRVANTGKAEYIPNVNNSSLRKDNLILAYGKPSSVYVVPLITRSRVVGIIATDAVEAEGVPEETRETLNVFGPQIAIALENARLYRRLKEQMEALKRSRALLSRAEKFSLLGNIAARLAHEIKNPMTAIGTFIQMLPHKFDDEEFRNDFYKITLEETERVNDLISELLDLVKSKESRFELNDLHGLIEKMILLLSPQSNAKQIEVVSQFDPNINQLMIDSEKTKEVILNLISNAIDSTHEGGRIEILTKKLTDGSREGGVCVEIKDNGEGIPETMIDKVFDPYFTTKHKSHMHNGTGLGLFIAYQNMKDHGGTIEVKSIENEETTFILTFPSDPVLATLSV